MVTQFNIVATASFSRSLKKLVRKNPDIVGAYEEMLDILTSDPFNISRRYQIKKLTDTDVGQWRIRTGVYRLRYDVEGNTVVLHLIKHRSNAY